VRFVKPDPVADRGHDDDGDRQQRADWHATAIANCQQKLKSGQFRKRVLFAECVNRVNAKRGTRIRPGTVICLITRWLKNSWLQTRSTEASRQKSNTQRASHSSNADLRNKW
jgi:hypothetical protein